MSREEILGKVNYYLIHYQELPDGFFSYDDTLILTSLDYNDIYRNNLIKYEDFKELCSKYYELKRAQVYYFIVRLNLLCHDQFYYDNQVLLDSLIPFKYDDMIVLKHVFKNNQCYNFFDYIKIFIDNGFDTANGETANLEKLSFDLDRYYNPQSIECYDNYKYVFRKHLSDVFNCDIDNTVFDFHNRIVTFDNFNSMTKLMGLAAEKRTYELLRDKVFNLKWVSRDLGDGYGFDFLVPRTARAREAGNLYEVKSSTKPEEKISHLLTANESEVFMSTLRDDSLYDYIIHFYDAKIQDSKFLNFQEPLVLFYDRLNKEVYDNHDIPYKIIQNDDGCIGFEDKIKKYTYFNK